MQFENIKIGIIGIGYVGLPLAVEFGKKHETIGFDLSKQRIQQLLNGNDRTLEVNQNELNESKKLTFTFEAKDLADCNIYIITVPTPIDKNNKPDLSFLKVASSTVGKMINVGDVIIYESTVFPGATEEVCVPILEEVSGLTFNKDFFCGYSPERINPGDQNHRISNIKKITSGSTLEVSEKIDSLYLSIISAGTYKASSIKIAEAAKAIENTQRDINIALINEIALICNKLNIDTEEVLKAAESKWNFISFRPGLVGGHCIGVDPYYLTYKAEEVGHTAEMILSGRTLNNSMPIRVSSIVRKLMKTKNINITNANILLMGFSFKQNCPDFRNTGSVKLYEDLINHGIKVDIYDPWVDGEEVEKEYKITLVEKPENHKYDAIIIVNAHDCFKEMGIELIRSYGAKTHVIFDMQYIYSIDQVDGRI